MTQPQLNLSKFSLGVGDRFAQQAEAQLRAFIRAAELGADVIPVWNKSNREHLIVDSEPASVYQAAERAVKSLGWKKPWHVDADHIRLETVDRFISCSDFYTIDVADSIGKDAPSEAVESFVQRHPELIGTLEIPGIETPLRVSADNLQRIARKYLAATRDVKGIYDHILEKRETPFVAEVSMDETDTPQTPVELLIILAALADESVPLQTIAPKFTGRFNKGVDYVGDVAQFEREFNDDLSVIQFAVEKYHLPKNLKLSVHSGSDKFSIYAPIRRALARHKAGLHIKTAGTTWLEEIIGLAEFGGNGLNLAKELYGEALEHIDELCAPYAAVIDVDRAKLPTAATVATWSSEQFAAAVRHNSKSPEYNPSMRQLLHVGYKVAAKKGQKYLDLVREASGPIGRNVTGNLFERHLKPIFLDK